MTPYLFKGPEGLGPRGSGEGPLTPCECKNFGDISLTSRKNHLNQTRTSTRSGRPTTAWHLSRSSDSDDRPHPVSGLSHSGHRDEEVERGHTGPVPGFIVHLLERNVLMVPVGVSDT